MRWYLRGAAALVQATEAAAFMIEHDNGDRRLRSLIHIRADDSSPEVRQAAQKAFVELAMPCINADKNGAIELLNRGEAPRLRALGPKFCLVVLIRGRSQEPIAAATFIVRCADQIEAKEKLRIVALQVLPDSGE